MYSQLPPCLSVDPLPQPPIMDLQFSYLFQTHLTFWQFKSIFPSDNIEEKEFGAATKALKQRLMHSSSSRDDKAARKQHSGISCRYKVAKAKIRTKNTKKNSSDIEQAGGCFNGIENDKDLAPIC